ncbi:MAG: hypothetical protein HOI54_07415 [Candidatus Marinimicrobia bacterium]|jgi:hypothetical protein|uniref:Uncharacterized protein n=1 Tax=uncultured marine virus TaxID=186617 RepID=A0A0F7L3I8_9VIRU|nr:hypothetical protein [uncultured marine virus]MBT6196831.1 hypothetical protein [Candidatus Neomarinimicrobiota bacterium]
MTINDEYHAKYLVLVAWVAQKTGLSEEVIEDTINTAYDNNMKEDLEEYCSKLYDGEEPDEE